MRIGTFISSDSNAKLRLAIPDNYSLEAVKSPAALTRLIANGECHLAMIDPLGVGRETFDDLLEALASSGRSLVIWTLLSEGMLSLILEAAQAVPTEFLFRGVDDSDVGALRAILRLRATSSVRALVLHRVAERLNKLDLRIRGRCAELFSGNPIPASVNEFVRSTRWQSRKVQRDFDDAGMCSPTCLLQVARIARTWEPLQTGTATLDEVASIANCSSVMALARHFAVRIGLPPRRAVREMTRMSFAERLTEALVPEGKRSGSAFLYSLTGSANWIGEQVMPQPEVAAA